MQLIVERNFSGIFNDTFSFLKSNFKHFWGNYFRIMIIPIILFLVIAYFTGQTFLQTMLSSYDNNMVLDDTVFDINNIILMGVLTIYLMLLFIFSFSYTPLYFMLYKEYGREFNYNDILATFKNRLPKILKFILGSILFSIVISIPFFIIAILLVVTVVGYLLIPVLGVFLNAIFNHAFTLYMSTDTPLMQCFSNGFTMAVNHFWAHVGATTLIYYIAQIVLGLVTVLPFYVYIMFKLISGSGNTSSFAEESSFLIAFGGMYLSSFILSLFTGTILQTSLALSYYSQEAYNNIDHIEDDINQIGQ